MSLRLRGAGINFLAAVCVGGAPPSLPGVRWPLAGVWRAGAAPSGVCGGLVGLDPQLVSLASVLWCAVVRRAASWWCAVLRRAVFRRAASCWSPSFSPPKQHKKPQQHHHIHHPHHQRHQQHPPLQMARRKPNNAEPPSVPGTLTIGAPPPAPTPNAPPSPSPTLPTPDATTTQPAQTAPAEQSPTPLAPPSPATKPGKPPTTTNRRH